ncbi:HAD family hydrolase [Vibrio astriarenae]
MSKKIMPSAILFDWGDTLMIDAPGNIGKMCDWPVVKATEGAQEVLEFLSAHYPIYIATNAQESTAQDIEQAFARVGLAKYLSGYFCYTNLSLAKDSPDFYRKIAQQLQLAPSELMMIGDTLDKDIYPAREAGLQAVLLNSTQQPTDATVDSIVHLNELILKLESCQNS